MGLEYSVVIPTRNGGTRIFEVLDALDAQRDAPSFEVVVVDDGSDDGTPDRLRARAAAGRLLVLEQRPRGPASARNLGVEAAAGERIAFLGDDTIPEVDWLARHQAAWLSRGGAREVAVLGYTDWHPRLRPGRFLRFLNEEGLQFGYGLIVDAESVPFTFFYTSNLSVDRELLRSEPFHEEFPYPAWEDIEAAYRLSKRGLRIVYESRAAVRHDHSTDFESFCARMELSGFCAVVFWRLHPELGALLGLSSAGPPAVAPRFVERARQGLVRALHPLPVTWRRLWTRALRDPYLRGLHRGWQELVAAKGEER